MALNSQHAPAGISSELPPHDEKSFGGEGYYGGFGNEKDVEAGADGQRKMSRIGRPTTKSIAAGQTGLDSDSDASISVGKQMELEAGNAIKYRTCSWQKVSCAWSIEACLRDREQDESSADGALDCSSALFRVHLPSHHVISLLLFCPRPGSWPYLDRRGRWNRSLHIFGCLVSSFS